MPSSGLQSRPHTCRTVCTNRQYFRCRIVLDPWAPGGLHAFPGTGLLGPEITPQMPQDSLDSATRGPQGNFHMADATQHPNNERLEKPQYWHKTAQRSHEPNSQWPLHSLIFNALCCLSFAFRCSLQWFALSYIALHGHCIKFSR